MAFKVPFVHRLRFTEDVLGADLPQLAEVLEPSGNGPARVQFWVDRQLAEAQTDLLQRIERAADSLSGRVLRIGPIEQVQGGEALKNDVHMLEWILKQLHAAELDRRSYVVVMGGGAVLDAVGFATAIAHRGLRLVRLPSTTLAQADSGVGVKNGVNLFQKKNWLGAFAVPWAVINDTQLLRSLSDRDFVCGFSEAVKVALLKSKTLFAELCREAPAIRRRRMASAIPMIRRAAQWHMQHITRGGDPFEMLEARPLDFGHWSAHRLEALTEFKLRHGEAVAIGVAIDTVYSSLRLGLPSSDASRVLDCLSCLGFELGHPVLEQTDALFEGLEEFRQHLGGRLTLTMLGRIGQSMEVHTIERSAMCRAIEGVQHFAAQHQPAS